eukprot:TRINITY_DN9935_c0_g1_i1.p1 TRINITY_DN9935_c0_g1~~TRINITY_DN9935_c0_g1_i1.p1  ORF type:complete len:832 (-),score=175.88 TRINITY_DN9935_c0_g1_i1:466-2961(-)
MSSFRLFLRDRSRNFSRLLCNLSFLRHMGGGPRTFPGGLNKWQWKRLHQKKAMEKEKKLLLHEKQLYEARVRTEIRAKLSGPSGRPFPSNAPQSSTHTPMTAKDHVRVLADRFTKEGAEDLWNEDDGPLKSPPARPRKLPGQNPPLDLRKTVSDRRNFESLDHRHHPSSGSEESDFESVTSRHLIQHPPLDSRKAVSDGSDESEGRIVEEGNALGRQSASRRTGLSHGSFSSFARRNYSVEARRPMSRFESRVKQSLSRDDGEFGSKGRGNSRRRRFSNGDSEDDSDSDVEGRVFRKNMMSSTALRNYDVKMTRRQPLKNVEEDNGSSQEIQMIRDELKRRVLDGNAERQCGEEEESHLSQKRFDECNISPLTIKALSSAGYVQMTAVQEATLPVCLEGKDVLVKAKTGTGKSVAFLLPAIESVLQATSSGRNQRVPPILVLVLSPTRELASQIAAEANVLLKYHVGIGVQTLIGGTRFKVDQKRLESDPCQIIVATPGRLLDHIENRSGFSMRLMGLKVLILDEADHLLDLGFRKDIEKIVDCVPRQRQSLLFSATIPKEVRRVSQLVLKRDHVYVDTVGLGGLETPAKVLQSYFIAPHVQHFQLVYQLLKEHMARVLDYKVIVFCTTAMVTSLMFLLLRELKMDVREIHSRKPQIYRARVSDEFRESKRLSLITSDVSARGMDYPDVTLVIQVGIPSDREQYIHRLGRTGREGKDGECMLVLAPWEEYFLDEIKDLPIEKSSFLRLDPDIKVKVEDCMAQIDASHKEAAYHAWLGYYNSIREIGREKTTLVELAKQFCDSIGLQKPPSMFRKTVNKMGLRDIPGIQIRK